MRLRQASRRCRSPPISFRQGLSSSYLPGKEPESGSPSTVSGSAIGASTSGCSIPGKVDKATVRPHRFLLRPLACGRPEGMAAAGGRRLRDSCADRVGHEWLLTSERILPPLSLGDLAAIGNWVVVNVRSSAD